MYAGVVKMYGTFHGFGTKVIIIVINVKELKIKEQSVKFGCIVLLKPLAKSTKLTSVLATVELIGLVLEFNI